MIFNLQIKDKSDSGKLIKVAPFKKDIRKTSPHKHNNYFEIIYLSEGSGTHYIDAREYPITPPVMFFVRKDQVHCWDLDSEPGGFVIIIKKAFIEESLDSELKSLFAAISKESRALTNEHETIAAICQLLISASNKTGKYAIHMIEGLLKTLLSLMLDGAVPAASKPAVHANLYEALMALLDAERTAKNKVQYYAEMLRTTPQNLNAACRKAVDQSAAEVLAEHIISEAKRLLHYTSSTVSEIAFQLDFTDASHFVKYFKRYAQQTPQAFRNS